MANTLSARISHMHDVEENWNKLLSFVPRIGEIIIYDKDKNNLKPRFKIGDGVTRVIDLPFSGELDLSEYISFKDDIGIIDGGRIS